MSWKKHTKKISELKESNTEIDMKVNDRLQKMVKEMADNDIAIGLEFLKDHLHLHRDTNDAIQELKHLVDLVEGVEYSVIADDSDQSVYIYFRKST
ncbi:MAG: hypothetical protein ACFFEK_12895 [Candidatus Thorarchaeota archaeon]